MNLFQLMMTCETIEEFDEIIDRIDIEKILKI